MASSSERGSWAVLNFVRACEKRGLWTASPAGHLPYDVIVHNPTTHEMWRVQVKTEKPINGRYYGRTHRAPGERYSPGMVSVFAFERADGAGFWMVEGTALETRSSVPLTEALWENWKLFGVRTRGGSGMWYQIRLPGPDLDSGRELAAITLAMEDRLKKDDEAILSGPLADLVEETVESYSRSQRDGSELVYFDDGGLRLYRESGGTKPVESTMTARPTLAPGEERDVVVVRGKRLSARPRQAV